MRKKRHASGDADPRTLARFRREVVVLLHVGHRVSPREGLRLIKKWDRYLKSRWRMGKPPCSVADHIAKFERERLVRPESRHAADPSRRRRRRRYGRDADSPKEGEVFESRTGNRWRVKSVSEKRLAVERAGHRSAGPFTWGRGALKGMKEVDRKVANAEIKQELKGSEPLTLFDPDGRRGKGKKNKSAYTRAKTAAHRSGAWRSRVSTKSSRQRARGSLVSKKTWVPVHRCPRSTKVQTLVFDRRYWTLAKAKAWARAHDYKVSKVDTTERHYRIRQLSPASYKAVGQKPFKRGLTAVMGCPRRSS